VSSQLVINKQVDGNNTVLEFIGQIDEDADFSLVEGLDSATIIFDLEKVTHINSCGIREWIKFQETLSTNSSLLYRKCPQVIVEQMNIVKGFVREGGKIESFYAPYFYEEKDEEVKVLLTPDQVKDGKAPEMKFEGTDNVMEFDDIEAQYFNFLKNS
jgi:anti-anti-sigma regulatory factor